MRDPTDIRSFRVSVDGVLEIDLERLEDDRVWKLHYLPHVDPERPDTMERQIRQYLLALLRRDLLMKEVGFTNGPTEIKTIRLADLDSEERIP